MMMKPRPGRESEIDSLEDLGEHTLLRQEPAPLVAALSSLFPEIVWRQEDGGGWLGALTGADSWYELRIEATLDTSWSIRTSHRAGRATWCRLFATRSACLRLTGRPIC